MTKPASLPDRPGIITWAVTIALCTIYIFSLWAPGLRYDDGAGYLLTTLLLALGVQRWRKSQPVTGPLHISERFLLLYLAVVAVGLFFNGSDVLHGIRHILYAGCIFVLLTRLENLAFIRNTTALVTGGAALLALGFALVEWSWQSVKAGRMIRYGFHDLSDNPNLTAFLIMAAILAMSTLMYQRKKQVLWVIIPAVSLFLCLFVFQTRSLFLGMPLVFALLALKGGHSRKIAWVTLAAVAIFLPILWSTGILQFFLEKGFNDRLSIWEDSYHHAIECGLMFGCGNEDGTLFGAAKHHPHSGYLGIMVYEGLPALLLFLGFLCTFVIQLVRHKTAPVWSASVIMVLAAALVTAPKFLMSFSAIWAYTWLPLALVRSEIRSLSSPGGLADR